MKKKLLLINIIVTISLIILIEIFFRFFLVVNVQGISSNLLNKNNEIILNNVNLKSGKAFGARIFTDENGYRIPEKKLKKNNSKIFFIGGSVTFGPAVKAEDTFVEMLNQNTKYLVKNTSVFGSDIENNYKIFKNIYKTNKDAKFYISLAFDDVSNERMFSKTENLKNKTIKESWVNFLKKNNIISYLNDFLRTKSATYVFFKTTITKSELRYYKNDLIKFEDINNLSRATLFFDKFAEYKNQITFYILPYSQQVNSSNCSKEDIAEKFFIKELTKRDIKFILFKKNFCLIKQRKKLFLVNDHAHLSKKGHELVYKIFENELIKN